MPLSEQLFYPESIECAAFQHFAGAAECAPVVGAGAFCDAAVAAVVVVVVGNVVDNQPLARRRSLNMRSSVFTITNCSQIGSIYRIRIHRLFANSRNSETPITIHEIYCG